MVSLLNIINLSVSIEHEKQHQKIIDNVSFKVKKSETLALVGESGSGKSLTALAIMQLLPANAQISPLGSILFNNQDLLTFSEIQMRQVRGRKIALVFQEAMSAFNPVVTIGDQVMEVFDIHFKLSRNEKYQRMIQLLEEVGLPNPAHYATLYPHQLSGGLKQRVMIAIALAGEPDLLIADEPTTALDVTLQAQILLLLRELQQKRDMGLIFITHDLGVVYQIADSVIVMRQGKIVEAAPAAEFFLKPQHEYSRQLFASLPSHLTRREVTQSVENNLLTVNNLKVYYPIKKGVFKRTVGYIKAVDDVSFALKEASTLALVGESGSGKTTTGMSILRLAPITAGIVSFQNHNLADLTAKELRRLRADFQVIFQDPYSSMNPRMTINDIIAEGMQAQNKAKAYCQQRVVELLQCVGLDPATKYRYPHEFSGGQRQRICIARALAVEPKFIVCDEPTSALDVSAQKQVLDLLVKLQAQLGLSYLLITHNIAVVAYMADEVAVMYQGKIVERGETQRVLDQPQHPYTQKLLNAVPFVPATTIESVEPCCEESL